MGLFDQLVDEALGARAELAPLRPVVEKELLHHDILREMGEAGLLERLVFMGGTCLRACYGSERLSEDLDFTGGRDFQRSDLAKFTKALPERLQARYGLPVRVGEPVKTGGNVSTWKITIETRPGKKHLPAQRIHLDICSIPSHAPRPMILRNPYGIDLGTSGLILQAESREEILADKVIALAFRENRPKNRDLWDIAWLVRQGIELPAKLVPVKIADHKRGKAEFAAQLRERLEALKTRPEMRIDFVKEMQRFLPPATVRGTIESPAYWDYLTGVLQELRETAIAAASIKSND